MNVLPQSRFAPAPLLLLAVALAAGILARRFFGPPIKSVLAIDFLLGVGLTLAAIWSVVRRRFALATGVVIAACVCAGLALSFVEARDLAPDRIAHLYDSGMIASGDPVELTGVLHGEPEPAPQGFYLTLAAEAIRYKAVEHPASGTVSLMAPVRDQQTRAEYDQLELRHGARVRLMIALDRTERFRNPGVSQFTEYLDQKGYDATTVIRSPLLVERLDDERVFVPLAWLYEWRQRLQNEFSARFSAETAAVLDAALLGNRYNLSHDAAERFRAGGTFHVLVIAGLHISFIGGVILLLVRGFTKRRSLQFLVATTLLWAYAIAVGAHVSVTRAALMFTLVALAPVVSRQANSLNAIGGAALALFLWRPSDLFDPSFQLTVLSVLAIVALAVPLLRYMQVVGAWQLTRETPCPPACSRLLRKCSEALFWSERRWRREVAQSNITYKPRKTPWAGRLESWHLQRFLRCALGAIVVSISVQIGLLPVLIIYFHRLSIASPFLNIFVGTLMAALAFAALAALIVSRISAWVAWPLIAFANKLNSLIIHSVDPFARIGIASIRLPHYTGWLASIYGLYYLALVFIIFALARRNPQLPGLRGNENRMFSPVKRRLGVALFAASLAVIVSHPFSAAKADGKLHADFLDVGQGDSALLTMPDGTTLLVDGGGRPGINPPSAGEVEEASEQTFQRDTRSIGEGVVSEYLWSRGLDHVDYILATHADTDHIDGLNDVARNFRVRAAIVGRTPADDPKYTRFAQTMKNCGVPVQTIGAGDRLRFGKVTAEALWPAPRANTDAPSRNNDSVMLRVRYGDKALLLTGDIEKEGEAAVLSQGVDLRSDVVKVPHHGSQTSSTPSLVAATHPSLAIISVGRTSIFGHPNKEVVERWRAGGAEVMTTGQRGTITIITDGTDLKVNTFVPQ